MAKILKIVKSNFVLFWILNIFIFDYLSIKYYLSKCSFPTLSKNQLHGIIIADPQLTDQYSYKQTGLLLRITEFYSDIYMIRNFKQIMRKFTPELVIFAGDMMDGGREWDNSQFEYELRRFNKIFHINPDVITLGVAGNHDIGFGESIIPTAYARFLKTFGNLNSLTVFANHTIIALDTIGLSGNVESNAFKSASSFLNSLDEKRMGPQSQRILISHVPIWREERADCGPRRRAPPLTNRAGYQYQSIKFKI